MKLVSLKCRIAFVVTMTVSYALAPTPDPFRKLRAGIKGSEVGQSPTYAMTFIPVASTSSVPVLSATSATTSASLAMSADVTTATAVSFADSTTALAPIRHAPITMTAGGVK